MSENHNGGNAIPEITREEHDGVNNAKRVNVVAGGVGQATVNIAGAATIYAVVNTSAPGVSNSIVTIANTPLSTQIVGNVTLSGPLPTGLNNIGFATVAVSTPTLFAVVNTSAQGTTDITSNSGITVYQGGTWTVTQASAVRSLVGNVTISDSKGFIGLTTVNIGSSNTVVLGSGVENIGFATVNQVNQPALVAGAAYIGLASVNIGGTLPALSGGVANIGFASVTPVTAWPDPKTFIGLVTVGNTVSTTFSGNVTLSDAKTYIGLVTATLDNSRGIGIVGNVTLSDSKAYIGLNTVTVGVGTRFIGLVTVVQSSSARSITGNLTLSDSKGFIGLATTVNGAGTQFIGLVTAWARNAGSAKTLVPVPFAFGASVATIAVPTNANVMYITNMILSANATTQVRMKSGVTYMTGNASIGISLNPNGGYVLTGAPDSPSWIGCPSGAIVLEKNDATTLVGGHLIYFQE